MKIATYNINGVRARLAALTDWLGEAAPDAVVLQEIKCVDEAFPREAVEEMGYTVETHGQKGWNGVAILARGPVEDVVRGLPGDPDDGQARWIEGTVLGEGRAARICGLYLPNGNPAPGPKYDYKLAWMARLEARAAALIAAEEAAIVLGDFNVIPEPRDADRPEGWEGDALYLPETRAAWRRVVNLGFHDATRETTQDERVYTFWDYQAGAWQKDHGVRIDHALLTPQAADRLVAAGIDRQVRAREKPSDHVPVWVELDL